jgi:hypothetical protein
MPPTCDTCSAHEQTMEDLREIRASQQRTEAAVNRILGYLGINGNGGQPHPHHRDAEPEEHQHRRKADDWRVKVMWGIGIFVAAAVASPVLAGIGGAVAKRLMP